ncbi:MAG: 50S ribosomal protein L11 methyltransferase [archaeon]
MTYQVNFTQEQIERIKEARKGLVAKTLEVPAHGKIVEHEGKPGNYYFVLPTVFQPNAGCIPLIENYKINKGERVLDFGTGCGVIAIDSAKRGAHVAVGIDINKEAVRSGKINAILHKVNDNCLIYDGEIVKNGKKDFNVITANLPFTNEICSKIEEKAAYDQGLTAHRELFQLAENRLTKFGRVYLAQANFGAVDEVLDLAKEHGFSHRLIGQKEAWEPSAVFYAFELWRKK